jgi:3-phenylpropionate/cinnamic acid dioxygenase small subunit
MDFLHQLRIQHTVTDMIQRYAQLNDAGDYYALTALFNHDARFVRPSQPQEMIQGKDCILQSFLNRPKRKTRHMVSNITVELQSETEVSAHSQIILFLAHTDHSAEFNQISVGGFHDQLVCIQGQWLFQQRLGYIDFSKQLL